MKTKINLLQILSIISLFTINSCKIGTNSSGENVFRKLTTAEKNNLNRFFTDFTEINTESFAKDALNDRIKITFAVYHNYRNNFKTFEQINNGADACIGEDLVARTANQYFGSKILKNQSTSDIYYENKKYKIQNSDGESFRFAQTESLIDQGNDIYTATILVFSAGSGWTGDINAAPETWKIGNDKDEIPQSDVKMKAVVKKITENGESHFVLLEFLNL
jgi:hypothetical protein